MQHVPDFVKTCKVIVDAVIDEMDAENCSVMLKDSVSNELFVRAARGKTETKAVYYPEKPGNGKRFNPGEGIAGWVLKEGQAVLLNDAKEEPRFVQANGLEGGVRSLICVPIHEKGQVVGVFNVSHSRKRAFDRGDELIVAYVSNQVGAALTSARFFLEIQEMNHLLKDSRESIPANDAVSASRATSSTFVEVGEMTQGNGLFIYTSERMHRIKEIVDQVANTDVTVLIQGESGVGKEVVARSIHLNSVRRDRPFIKVNCAAIPQDLLESELFGYEKGAFTGAYRQKPGRFELAEGGTIFLDEIAEIPSSLQAKLLQVLQDREFSRLGGKRDIRVDVRVIVATNRNMEESVKSGRFREDLYYRMNVVNIHIPPLRERREEIQVFIEYFCEKFGKKYGKTVSPLSERTLKTLMQHPWLGNVRELENAIQRYVVLGDEDAMFGESDSVMKDGNGSQQRSSPTPLERTRTSLKEVRRQAVSKAEGEVIRRILEQNNWNRKRSAELLNISYKALLYKIKECGIHKHSMSPS